MIDIARKTSQQVKYFVIIKVTSITKRIKKHSKKSKARNKVKKRWNFYLILKRVSYLERPNRQQSVK